MILDPDIQALIDDRSETMKLFTADHQPINMYAVYRTDLEMPSGKVAAQLGHAFSNGLIAAERIDPQIVDQYRGTGNGTKLAMYAKNLNQLIKGYRAAQAASIPCELIIDRGHVLPPHFDGNPVITALVIGPVLKSQAQQVTKLFTMVKS